jgi:hypothetical protein
LLLLRPPKVPDGTSDTSESGTTFNGRQRKLDRPAKPGWQHSKPPSRSRWMASVAPLVGCPYNGGPDANIYGDVTP